MVESQRIVEVARSFIGTPWHHDARLKGVGIDCTGLIAEVWRECGVPVQDVRGYGKGDEYDAMVTAIAAHAFEVAGLRVQHGDVACFRGRQMWNHCGFVVIEGGEASLIHAYSSPSVMKVVEQPFDSSWWRRLVAAYRYRGTGSDPWHA